MGQGSVVTTLLQGMRAVPRGTGFLRVYSGRDGRATISSAAPAGLRMGSTVRSCIRAFTISQLAWSASRIAAAIRFQRRVFPASCRRPAFVSE